ncbi:MAG: hypothetical protein PHQ14_05255 [Chromatiales bacterium]|jgi:hypothetical protein|nr:hypothetical protein [Chromatiales bacterium]MDX9766195.1 exosortase H-associated membrane protein [Ectothiorhodospiraceae bacterium]
MGHGTSPLTRFVLRLLVGVPLCVLAWWFLARDGLLALVAGGGGWFAERLMAEHVVLADHIDGILRIRTSLSPLHDPLNLAVIEVDPARFTLAFPVFWALILATPDARQRLLRLVFGTFLLVLPLAILMALLFVQFNLALIINNQPMLTERPPGFYVLALPYPGWAYHLMGVGRQLGLLIMPVVVPVIAWGVLNHRFVQHMIGSGQAVEDPVPAATEPVDEGDAP